jgi:hypothetical protein
VNTLTSEISIRGKSVYVPMARVDGREVIVKGRWLRIASIRDEEWLENQAITDPARFVSAVRASGLRPDLVTFAEPLDKALAEWNGNWEFDNVAAILTKDHKAWWDGLSEHVRRNVRLAEKRGVEIRLVKFDDEFVKGVKAIYDETPVRQGRKFWHYGKDFDTVKRINATYIDRSEFLGAYYSGQLIGFIKWVYVGDAASIMQILCMNAHQDKRTMTALIAKAVGICHEKGLKYFIYVKFSYGKKVGSSIAEFKRRLGFRQMDFRRYYVPLTWRGRIALKLGIHNGWLGVLPPGLVNGLLRLRGWWIRKAALSADTDKRGRGSERVDK